MMTELMVAVERAVRPVRAGGTRKMRMRQELLAHLTASYEEEKARLSDDHAAVAAAVRRFGDPKEITRDLQASVPLLERTLCAPVPGTGWLHTWGQALKSLVGRIDRPAILATLWAVFSVACEAPVAWLRYSAGPQAPSEGWVIAICLGAVAVLSFAFMGCFCRMCQALDGEVDRRRALIYGALTAALLIVATVPQYRLLLGPGELTAERLARAAVTAVLTVIGLAWVVRFSARRRAGTTEWARLEIGQ